MENIQTTVRLYYKGENAKREITHTCNLPEQETHSKLIGKIVNIDGVAMKCWKVETIDIKRG